MRVYSGITRVKTLFLHPRRFFSIQPKYGTTVKPWALLANHGKLVQYYFEIPVFGAWLGPISGKLVQTNYQRWMIFSRNWADSCLAHLPIRANWLFLAPVLNSDSLMSRFGLSLENFGKKVIRHSTLLKISFTLNKRAFRCIRKTHNKVCSRINSTDAELDCENTLDHRIQLR